MSAQSDRIRAALQRSEAKRESGEPSPDPGEQVKIAVNSEYLAALLGPKTPSNELLNAASPPAIEPPPVRKPAEVETTLPLVAASDQKRAALPRVESQSQAVTESKLPETNVEPATSGSRRIVLLAAGLAIVLAGIAAILLRNHWSSPKQSAQTPPPGLQLKVEPQNNGLINVQWNPRSGLVTQAREGRLVISESDQQPRVVALNSEQLKSGHVYYQSSANRIEFRLQVVDASGATAEESVLGLSSKPAAVLPVDTPSAAAHPATAPTAAANTPNPTASAEPTQSADAPQNPQPSRPAARPFIPPQPNRPTPANASTISLDPPAPAAGGDVIAPGTGLTDPLKGVPQPQAVAPRINVGGNVQNAKLIKKVAPVYPALAKAARAHGSVRFSATIGKDGRIQNLQLLSGNPTLVLAATDAVKQWVYEPTLLNGEPIEVITQIEVNFSMNP